MATASSRQKVLIVNDEQGTLIVLRIKLRHSGFDVITTTSGSQAIELIRTEKPDAVLLDMVMPEVTGVDVLQRVRPFAQMPIIVFTARSDAIEPMLKSGANDFIPKPSDPELVVAKIREILSKASHEDK